MTRYKLLLPSRSCVPGRPPPRLLEVRVPVKIARGGSMREQANRRRLRHAKRPWARHKRDSVRPDPKKLKGGSDA